MANKHLLGSTEPRIYTPPLRRINRQTSDGYAICERAEANGVPFLPWQAWLVKHAAEKLPDGRPRFRIVLVIVARQAGKTTLLNTLTKYWLVHLPAPALILGTSTKLATAKRNWSKVERWARSFGVPGKTNPYFAEITRGAGSECITTVDGTEYIVSAANSSGGRGESIDRGIVDELREHHTFEAWDAIEPATIARPNAQIWAITNQGDDESVVLHDLREQALKAIEDRNEDSRIGLFEWSAPDGCDPQDPSAWAAAQPALGYTIPVDDYRDRAARAVMAGGSALAGFRTEYLCQRVKLLDPSVDPDRWQAGYQPGNMLHLDRDRIALCLDVAPNSQHVSLVAAAEDGTTLNPATRVELVKAWEGAHAVDECRRELPELVQRIRPRVIGWFPNGPAAVMAADMKERRPIGWPPAGVKIEEVKGDMAAVCMGFAEQVAAGRVLHSGQEILDAHVMGAQKLYRANGDLWVFSRKGGTCDAAYAAAGAVNLVRHLPAPAPQESFSILSV